MNPEIDKFGTKYWYKEDGSLHRDDGPAIEYLNGDMSWYKHGKLHRENGPAIDWHKYSTPIREFWLENISYKENEYWEKVKGIDKCKLLILRNKEVSWF